MSKKILSFFTVALTLLLAACSPILNVRALPTALANSDLPDPPDRGTPKGDSTPGGTRPEATCEETDIELTALNQNAGKDFTASESPTFWFYVPYQSDKIRYMEFSLHDREEKTTIYSTQVKLEGQPGIIKISIPLGVNSLPEPNELYRWYFSLDCEPDTTEEFDRVLNGWVRWLPMDLPEESSLLYAFYWQNEIWHDAITNLAERYFANPENTELERAWTELLSLLGDRKLADKPLVDFKLLPPEE